MIQASRSRPSGTGTLRWAFAATGFNSPAKRLHNSPRRHCTAGRRVEDEAFGLVSEEEENLSVLANQ